MDAPNTTSLIPLLEYLERNLAPFEQPMSELLIRDYGRDPFLLLIACILSLRARDRVVYQVCKQLFALVCTLQQLVAMDRAQLEQILRPIGFYRTKAATIQEIGAQLVAEYGGQVPLTVDELLKLKGVGRKTAQFMIAYAAQEPAICVDTHVHRLANKFGWIKTRTPEQTERELERLIPREWWSRVNTILVGWGQNVCTSGGTKRNKELHDKICLCKRIS